MLKTKTVFNSPQIKIFLAGLTLAPRQVQKQISLWPLLRAENTQEHLRYITLSEAIGRGDLDVDELTTGAQVPHVQVVNRGDVAVLILFGEEIRGAKQNRIANASFLVPAHAEVVLDVSCVEQGRWSRRRRGEVFAAPGEIISRAMKLKMARRVAEARGAGRGFDAGQSEVWGDVAERVAFSNAASPTGAYSDYLETRSRDLDEISAAFRPIEGQVGFVAMVGDEIMGLEAIGHPETFAAAFGGLLRSYVIDAIDTELLKRRTKAALQAACFGDPESFLAELSAVSVHEAASLGIGKDVRFESTRVRGCALVDKEVIHLTAFPEEGA